MALRSSLLLCLSGCFVLHANPVPILVDSFSVDSFTGSSDASGTNLIITNGSMLNYLDQSTAGNASISIDGTSELFFTQTIATTYSGQLSGSGMITKNGVGNLTISGNNSGFTGPLSVQTGTLFLSGSYGGNVLTSPGTSIFYLGPISGDLNVTSGTISTIGINTLMVGGNYTQTVGSLYAAAVNSAGQSTLIDIAGTATIAGDVSVDTSGGVLFNHLYPILHAAGGVTGSYNLVGVSPFLMLKLSYDLNDVYVSIMGATFMPAATTPNEKAVAKQLNSITDPTADELEVINAIVGLSMSEAQKALNLLSGEQYANFILAAFYGDGRFNNTLYNAYRGRANACSKYCESEAWVSGGGGKGNQKGSNAASGFKLSHYEVDTGVHGCIQDAWTLGGALGYETDALHSKLAGNADLQTGRLALYSAYQSKYFYVFTDIIGSKTWASDYHRPIHFGTLNRKAKSHVQVQHGRFDLQIGANIGRCRMQLQPYVAGSVEGYHQRKLKEHGAHSIDLSLRQVKRWFATTDLGFYLNMQLMEHLTLSFDAAWEHDFGKLKITQRTHFADFGSWFTIEGSKRGHNGAVGSVLFAGEFAKAWNLYVEASGELWKNWSSYAFTGGIGYQW